MNIVGIIPARMGSSRFPGKPLAKILNIPMLGHVLLRSKMSKTLSDVYVATCDKEIADYVESIGGKSIMTLDTHERATDRTAEAMAKIERDIGRRIDVVVMIQGDEPMLRPEMIDEAIEPMLKDDEIQVVNLMAELKTEEEQNDPNEVKVVADLNSFAMYFSREPIPSRKKGKNNLITHKQVCIIPFRRNFLIKFNNLPATPLEIIESVDMLRLLEHGFKVKMVLSGSDTYSVDIKEDLRNVEDRLKSCPLVEEYIERAQRKVL